MNLPELELKILQWWKENKVFEKSVDKSSPKGDYVFYEGPPTANGKPGIHHVLSRSFKDIIPRFKTMQGYRVVRKGGWDTHGLPVELEVEKQLGLKNKKEVEEYGIGPFNQKCRESVWTYKNEWEKFTMRMGFWLDLPHAYITYEGSYVNALWGVIKKIWERGLLVEGHKVVPHCPRCGTALSSHELAQGYATVKDTSVTIKFKVKSQKSKVMSSVIPTEVEGSLGKLGMTVEEGSEVYILSWTTTPWTLPGNVGLAVGMEIDYVVVRLKVEGLKLNEELLIVAKERLSDIEGEYEVLKEIKGSELVGLEYEPLFNIPALKSDKSYKVYGADFVSTTDGTGVVHTAVMYGEDDYRLGTEVGLPKHHTVDPDGKFNASTPELLRGKFVKDPKTEGAIISDLETRGLLFRKELYEHEYPFCWRCKTPLLYYAKHSWFVAMSKLRQELLDANNQINWVPDYIKEGRFGEWLREVKDWAFSRERYWGTPLPVWRCQTGVRSQKSEVKSDAERHPELVEGSLRSGRDDSEGCGKMDVVGSVAELVQKARLKNRYIFIRHGESKLNVEGRISGILELSKQYPLTEKGREQVMETGKALRHEGIELIIASPFGRTKETAELLGKALNITVQEDIRLRELNMGALEGKTVEEGLAFHHTNIRLDKRPEGGESHGESLARMMGVMHEFEVRLKGKTIIVVSHGDPLWILQWTLAGRSGKLEDFPYPQFAQPVIMDHGVILTDERGELDLHRPRVDAIEWPCECGGVMRRVPEVADVWFDSGAMPFAQYPENVEVLRQEGTEGLKQYPADYISEAIDQTRGWFYTLLAVSVALGRGTPYKNVICLGHVLDAKGKKMSKSLGNIVVPGVMFDKYGADAVRWYLYTINDPGLPKRFDERELNEVVKKFFMIMWNVMSFHELYPPQQDFSLQPLASLEPRRSGSAFSLHVLDRWILARLNQLTKLVTERLESYDVTPAARSLQEFVTELSTWYVRRSRERMKAGEGREVLKHVLTQFSKLLAPFVPFTADALWQRLTASGLQLQAPGESVHLSDWPEVTMIDEEVLSNMDAVRKIVEAGLAARAAAKMPIRQPLASAKLKAQSSKLNNEFIELISDELNVKEVLFEQGEGEMIVELDTNLTEELKLEGMKRELIRAVNNLRKEAKLTIKDRIELHIQDNEEVKKMLNKFEDELLQATLASSIKSAKEIDAPHQASVKLGEVNTVFGF